MTLWHRAVRRLDRGFGLDWPGDLVAKSWYELAHRRDEARRLLIRHPPRRGFALSPHAHGRRIVQARPKGDWLQRHPGAFWAWTSAPAAAAAHWCKRQGYHETPF